MNLNKIIFSWQKQIVIGLIIGLTISVIDNYAFKDELSPVVLVLMLLTVSGFSGLLFGWHGWFTVFIIWLFVPATNFIKYIFDLKSTLHPNTINSILKFTLFSFAITVIGFAIGVILRRFINQNSEEPRP